MCEAKMDFINPLEKRKRKLAKKLQKELLIIGTGVDNSAFIDKLNDQIAHIEETIDTLYMIYNIPRDMVKITPYAYLHGLSTPNDIKIFFDKLSPDSPGKNILFNSIGKLVGVANDF